MSGNFFLYSENFFKGLRLVLIDMKKKLEPVKCDPGYREIYVNTVKVITSPYLIELIKIYVKMNELVDCNCRKFTAGEFLRKTKTFGNVPSTFVNLYRDLNKLIISIKKFYREHENVSLCDAGAFLPHLNSTAFPCSCCMTGHKMRCITPKLYPLTFMLWLIGTIGRIETGCLDVDAVFSAGFAFTFSLAVIDEIDQFNKVSNVMQGLSSRIIKK